MDLVPNEVFVVMLCQQVKDRLPLDVTYIVQFQLFLEKYIDKNRVLQSIERWTTILNYNLYVTSEFNLVGTMATAN